MLLPVVTYEIMMTRIDEDRARSLARYRQLHASQDHLAPASDTKANVIELRNEKTAIHQDRIGA